MSDRKPLDRLSVRLERPDLSEYERYVIVPEFEHGEPPGGPQGSPGDYRVVLVLGVPGIDSVVSTVHIENLESGGDSLVASPMVVVELEDGAGGQGSWTVHSNEQGHLSRAEVTVHASSLPEAEKDQHDQVTAIISRLAFQANAAVEVQAMVVTEVATGTKSVSAQFVGKIRPLQAVVGQMNPRVSSMLAAYREGSELAHAALPSAFVLQGG